ncbi:MAG: terpene cyclase/mutase family protein [Phycisphaerales bacterium]|nr:terpene cyclase/mutase family protein [Phycisphaerales bacterium]
MTRLGQLKTDCLIAFVALLLLAPGAGAQVGEMKPVTPGRSEPDQAKPVQSTSPDADLRDRAIKLMRRGAHFLIASQRDDGAWGTRESIGVAALATRALALSPDIGPRHPATRSGVKSVIRSQRKDGGIYSAGSLHQNYETSVAISMLAALKDETPRPELEKARDYVMREQWDESENRKPDDTFYGGAGYGGGMRPDLSNTQIMLDALHDSGLPQDDPAYAKAMVFVQRCQMRAETNDQPFARGAADGGFIYSPAGGGESKAGAVTDPDTADRRLRTYGTMTYAGFKSMLYAGLSKNDPRVQAAWDWIRDYYTLDHNPNMPETQSRQGLFYFYHVFARALAAWDDDVVVDRQGRRHEWRRDLVEHLEAAQRPDGSWVNEEDRWMEGNPTLATSFAMLALAEAFDLDQK